MSMIFYACVTMVLESKWAYDTIQAHEPQAETDSLKLFWFCQISVLSILIISTTKRGSQHTNSQYFLA